MSPTHINLLSPLSNKESVLNSQLKLNFNRSNLKDFLTKAKTKTKPSSKHQLKSYESQRILTSSTNKASCFPSSRLLEPLKT